MAWPWPGWCLCIGQKMECIISPLILKLLCRHCVPTPWIMGSLSLHANSLMMGGGTQTDGTVFHQALSPFPAALITHCLFSPLLSNFTTKELLANQSAFQIPSRQFAIGGVRPKTISAGPGAIKYQSIFLPGAIWNQIAALLRGTCFGPWFVCRPDEHCRRHRPYGRH